MTDWGETWDLPTYPQLPKLFTSTKEAKKRKHKEFILTDELLEQPVKLPRQQQQSGKQAKQHGAANGTAAANTAQGVQPSGEQKQKKSKKSQQREGVAQDMDATAATADAAARKKDKKQKQQHVPEQQGPDGVPAATLKDQKRRKKEQQQQLELAAAPPSGAAADAAAAADGMPVTKKSKNKFKQPAFLEQQQQLGDKDASKQKHKQLKQAQQQQQQQQADTGVSKPEKASKKAKKAAAAAAAGGAMTLGSSTVTATAAAKQPQKPQTAAAPAAAATPGATASKQQKPLGNQQQQKTPVIKPQLQQQQRASPAAAASSGGSKLLQQFKERLAGSRFRQLNEALYTQPGDESYEMLQEQPELFQQYHEGFQQQVKSWPTQPLDAAIAWLESKPEAMTVADFGCGDARLAAIAKQTVHSLDLVATAPGVIACNMADTPLGTGSCDAAVFSLALMGLDYGAFLVEAARVLKQNGWLWIAEVRSRFAAGGGSNSEDFRPFLSCLQQLGFKLVKQDASNRMFVVFVLKKLQQAAAGPAAGIKWPPLKACVYKKR